VHLIDVDVVGAQALEAGFEARLKGGFGGGAGPLQAELGRQDEVVTVSRQEPAQDGFGFATAVDVGGIDEGQAVVEGRLEDGAAGLEVGAAAEVVSAQPQDGHREAGIAHASVERAG